jgi:hypothetical protein
MIADDRNKEIEWLKVLSEEDVHFVKRFVLSSGSLKQMAQEYGVSYPTLRIRLNRLIVKIRLAEDPIGKDPFILLIRTLVVDGRLSATDAKEIIAVHKAGGNKT